jgi:sigma-B regulation protein RsbU (phosphoserine phosphatase)
MIAPAAKARILVVDDEPGVLRAVSRVCGQHYTVECASSAAEALGSAGRIAPDVAILDVRMPEMNGFELMARLHATMPELDVILMTGNAEEPDANLVRAIDAGAFYFIQKPFERRVLQALVGRCMELRRLREDKQRYLERLRDELEQARRFQKSLLPPEEATFASATISARYLACGELAGDFYDYADAAQDGVALLIADVVGHGASAAMLTGLVKSAFRAAEQDRFHPAEVVRRIREGVLAFDGGRFITACCARLDPAARQLTYVNAGHPPPLLLRTTGATVGLSPTGPLISSAVVELECDQAVVDVGDGDLLLLYTDGVTDASGSEGHFGHKRLAAAVADGHPQPTRTVDAVQAAVGSHLAGRPNQDDMTLLAAQFHLPAS